MREPLRQAPGTRAEPRARQGPGRRRDMRFADVAHRAWPDASKRLERVRSTEVPVRPEERLRKHAPGFADSDEAIRLIREIAPRRFFAGVAEPGTQSTLAARLPHYSAELLTGADALVTGHPSLVHLAQAWTVTGDARYALACVRAVDPWLEANPPSAGVNRTGGIDVSQQMMSWCWTLMLLRDWPALSPAWVHKVLGAIWWRATGLRRYLSYSHARNTDLTGEALGLFYAATLFPEFRQAARWREVSVRTLIAESEAQAFDDGVHVEQSTSRHRRSVETYLHFLLLAERNGIDLPAQVNSRVLQMLEFLLAVRQTDGTIPAIGDADGRTLLPLADRSSADSRGVFAVAAAIFHRRDFVWAADGLAPEVLWLMGPDGVRTFDRIGAVPPASGASRIFPSGGYAVMRSSWAPDAHQAIVDIGPIGGRVSGSQGHADLLSIQCAIFGEPCLVDAGADSSAGDPQWREFFRSTAAHSAVIVDGVSQAEPAGPVGWRSPPRVRLREWHSTPAFDFLDAEHDGYLSLLDPVVHRRRVIFVKPGYWILVDDLSGAARHHVTLAFQFGPLDVTLGTHPWARSQTPGGRVLWIATFPSAPAHSSLECGELAPPRGWISRERGERQPAPILKYSFDVALPWRTVTLLFPDRRGLAFPPAVRAICDDAGRPTGLAFERPRRVVRFDDRAVTVECK